jgi:broad specificity phosphatase PhoE
LRHAEADLRGRFCGHSNPGLSAQGRAKIPAIVQGLSLASISPTTICSSDLRRAIETVEPIANHFGFDYSTSAALREMNFGCWEGLTWSEVELQYAEDAQAWIERFPHHRPPGGESFSDLKARVRDELESLAKRAQAGCTLAVTHAGFIRTAIAWVLGMDDKRISRIAQNYGGITVIENINDHWSVAALNLDLSRFADMNMNKNGDGQP